MGDGESEAVAGCPLGGEKGCDHVGRDARGDAAAGVLDGEDAVRSLAVDRE